MLLFDLFNAFEIINRIVIAYANVKSRNMACFLLAGSFPSERFLTSVNVYVYRMHRYFLRMENIQKIHTLIDILLYGSIVNFFFLHNDGIVDLPTKPKI